MATYTSNYAWAKPSGSDPVDISVLNGNLDSQDGIIHDAFLNMAVPFSELSTYTVGDIVLYGTKTYKCRVPVTTPGSWTGATNWDEYKLSEGGLVAGDYINIQNGVVNVQTEIGTYNYVRYELESTGGGAIKLIVRKYVNNVLDSTTEYPNDGQHHEIDDVMDTWYEYGPYLWHYKLLVASIDHAVGYEESWSYQDTSVHTVNFQFAQDDSTTLVTKGDLDNALDDKVDKVTGKGLSTNDYTDTDKAEVAKVADKADKTATASGETLALVPTSEGRALLHTAYGMSTQSGTPTPSSPVDIESAKADFVCKNKNLIKFPYSHMSTITRGITWSMGDDGALIGNGTWDSTNSSHQPYCETNGMTDNDEYSVLVSNVWYTVESIRNSQYAMGTRIYFLDFTTKAQKSIQYTYCRNGGEEISTTDNSINQATSNLTIETVAFKVSEKVYAQVQVRYMNKNQAGGVAYTLTNDKQYPILMVGKYSSLDEMLPYVTGAYTDITTDLTLRAIEVTSSDAYNLVRDGKYYIADTLDYSEDSGFGVTRRVGTDKFDGSESWILPGDRATQYGYSFRLGNYDEVLTGIISKTGNIFDLVTDKFRCFSLIGGQCIYSNISSADWGSGIYRTIGNVWISMGAADMSAEGVTDLASFQTWLSNHNVDILYPITPITETITTEQALALLGLKTYDESTTISSQAEPSCTVAVEYAKERLGALALTAYNMAKGNDLRITALEG